MRVGRMSAEKCLSRPLNALVRTHGGPIARHSVDDSVHRLGHYLRLMLGYRRPERFYETFGLTRVATGWGGVNLGFK